MENVQKHSVHTLVFRSLKRTHDMFISHHNLPIPKDEKAEALKLATKIRTEYGMIKDTMKNKPDDTKKRKYSTSSSNEKKDEPETKISKYVPPAQNIEPKPVKGKELITFNTEQKMLIPRKAVTIPKPRWHPPWKLYRVLSGHGGWVRAIDVEPANQWFATGAGDRIIKIWDLASGELKLSLTGHVSTVRGVAVSPRHPYLFSGSEDKTVKCWDLEQNKVIRHYHGHLSAVYSVCLHPTIDLVMTAGRDCCVRVWDMRTKASVHTMTGHSNTIASVRSQATDPQVLSGSHDSTIRLWDLRAGRSLVTLTNHKKSVRAMTLHPAQNTFASASPDNIKQWKLPQGEFLQNMTGHNALVNALTVNGDDVVVSGGDNGTLYFWDWKTGYNFQRFQAAAQPGSIESENGILALTFDHSGSRLLTAECDKTIKFYKEDEEATEETHPVKWKPDILRKAKY